MSLLADDNCDYDSDGNGRTDRNWAADWIAANPSQRADPPGCRLPGMRPFAKLELPAQRPRFLVVTGPPGRLGRELIFFEKKALR